MFFLDLIEIGNYDFGLQLLEHSITEICLLLSHVEQYWVPIPADGICLIFSDYRYYLKLCICHLATEMEQGTQ